MAIEFTTPQSRTIAQGVKPAPTEAEIERNQRMIDGTFAYLETFASPMNAQKTADALRKQQGFNGKFMSRAKWVDLNFWSIEKVDYDKKRIVMKDGAFFTFKDVTKATADYVQWLFSIQTEKPVCPICKGFSAFDQCSCHYENLK